MGLDQYIEMCKHTEDIMQFVDGDVLQREGIDDDWFYKYVGNNEVCYWRKQYWVHDYIEHLMNRDIDNCDRVLLNKYHVKALLNAYDLFIEKLAPLWNPETGICEGVTKDIIDSLEGKLGITIYRLDDLEESLGSDYGYIYSGIRETYDKLKDILFEMEHTDYCFFYHGWW